MEKAANVVKIWMEQLFNLLLEVCDFFTLISTLLFLPYYLLLS